MNDSNNHLDDGERSMVKFFLSFSSARHEYLSTWVYVSTVVCLEVERSEQSSVEKCKDASGFVRRLTLLAIDRPESIVARRSYY